MQSYRCSLIVSVVHTLTFYFLKANRQKRFSLLMAEERSSLETLDFDFSLRYNECTMSDKVFWDVVTLSV